MSADGGTEGGSTMLTKRHVLAGGSAGLLLAAFGRREALAEPGLTRTDAEWRERLTPEQYAVLRQNGTERPYTSRLLDEKRSGSFACAGCDLDLFSSTAKYDSGTGWPSFYAPLEGAVATEPDSSFGMVRTAVHCSRCEGHLGHVFDDGPPPTGLRYCINGIAMTFEARAA
jgi:peptide-methionine (R)-S-oxide reductase